LISHTALMWGQWNTPNKQSINIFERVYIT
jgi:hypothetical protein